MKKFYHLIHISLSSSQILQRWTQKEQKCYMYLRETQKVFQSIDFSNSIEEVEGP